MFRIELRNVEQMHASLAKGAGGHIGDFSRIVKEIRWGESELEVIGENAYRLRSAIQPAEERYFDTSDREDKCSIGANGDTIDVPHEEIEKLLLGYEFANSCHRQMVMRKDGREFVLNFGSEIGTFVLDSYHGIGSLEDFTADLQEYANVLKAVISAIHLLGSDYPRKRDQKSFTGIYYMGRDFKQKEK